MAKTIPCRSAKVLLKRYEEGRESFREHAKKGDTVFNTGMSGGLNIAIVGLKSLIRQHCERRS